jgi:16S rRNA (guanine527-N7)-methyltransferase
MPKPFSKTQSHYERSRLEGWRLGEQNDLFFIINIRFNTAINKAALLVPEADEDVLFLRHFCDSLQPLLLFGFKKGATALDIGPSSGFPIIPVRIFRPDISFTVVEPDKKKVAFLERVKTVLGFDNLEIIHGKAVSIKLEEKSDYVISRGAGSLHKFAQLAKTFLAKDGHMYTYKTKQFTAELEAMTPSRDGVKVREIAQYDLGNVIHGLSLVSMIVL